ncbi:MAG TPA: hypothetical protein VGX75_13215 [bacterium]|nr:hypothetical protein [bacterium]
MWPELVGQGSELGLFVAGSILAGLAAIVWFAMRAARRRGPDPVADLHRRYEQGDLRSEETARLFRILADQQAVAEQSAQRFAPARRAKHEGNGDPPADTRVPRGPARLTG